MTVTPAERLVSAEAAFLRAESDVERLLDALYDRWQDFEVSPTGPTLDVYGVIESPAAVDALKRAGFRWVVQHEHVSKQFRKCGCRRAMQ